ncbi:extracellular solute-binding protein [Paenibacillus sp.]|uniref:extracellular solute-binding protein n=1 Tax=Paenibacillus sp. TaxID=58172 RepID=UPI002D6849C6|nr:extracellular solute-binding protein [Paenibacillus sp.]HZG86645.1 extracellular solute-binding protein [Paenibacillus sp.]
MFRNKPKHQRAAQLAAVSLSAAVLLTACGGNAAQTQNGSASTNAGQADDAPTKITVMSQFFSPTPPATDGPVEQEIEKATNTDLTIQWVSANNYIDKFNVTLASGSIPDLILVSNPFDPVFLKAAKQGAFWDVSPYIQDYPNIASNISQVAWDLTKIEGKNFGVPRPRPSEGDIFFVLRKDWLDNVGLQPPTTIEELHQVMKAFTEQDPDGNGQHDTIGFTGYVNPTDMGSLWAFERVFTKATGEWKLMDNGELVHTALLPETRESLLFLNQAYNEGLIPKDFASMKVSQSKDMFKAGQAGMIEEKTGTMQEYYDIFKAADPNFDFLNLYPLTNVEGFNTKGPGFSGMNAIPKSVPEEKMKKILAMIDQWMSEDVFILHSQGIEGVHHTVKDGEIVIDSEKVIADAIGDYNQIVYVADPYASTVKKTFPEEAKKFYAAVQDERAKTSVVDVGIGLQSETGLTYMPELRKKIQDLKTKIILGGEPIEAWDKYVETLKSDSNFQKVTAEMNEAYKSR